MEYLEQFITFMIGPHNSILMDLLRGLVVGVIIGVIAYPFQLLYRKMVK